MRDLTFPQERRGKRDIRSRRYTQYFADDGALMADTLWGLQLALDTCWWVTHVAGLNMIVKADKSKTAWQER